MADIKNIQLEIDQLRGLQVLAQAYEEIASTRMKKSRSAVLSRRDFMTELNQVFEQVRNAYAEKVAKLLDQKQKRGGKITFLSHNGKTVAVLLSANTGLYGDIVQKTFKLFMDEVRRGDVEVTIVGRHGLSLFLQEMPGTPYTYFDLPDHSATSEQLQKVISHIVQYEKIHVFYGKFVNVINQAPTVYSISAEIDVEKRDSKLKKMYIFEPELEKIMMFFEKEIFASLFEQSVSESELAKSASRVVAMDRAATNISDYLSNLRNEKLRAMHREGNRKQINSMSAILMRV